MYERSGGSMSIEERLANRGATTHVGKLDIDELGKSFLSQLRLNKADKRQKYT